MNRKIFCVVFAAALLALSVSAQAQQGVKVRTVGFLGQAGGPLDAYEVFRQELRNLGYVEGANIAIEHRPVVDGSGLAEKATELVRLKVDVVVTTGGISTRAVQQATKSIPIVFTSSGDPIEGGFIDSLARPGKNLTGITFLAYELVGKRLELLKEAVPRVSRVAVIANPAHPGEQRELRETRHAAQSLRIALQYHQIKTIPDFDAAFEAIIKERSEGLLVFPDAFTLSRCEQIVEFAEKRRLPAIFGWQEYVEAGSLMSYGPNRNASYRRIAVYVDKILKGAKPADLPTELPTKFELIINLKTAKQIGLTIPPNVLARADRVIR